jgi:2-keto-4-pentenoate hydratase/2-oxohepta-3-ene-1,7-dioic acid hydratase in catechol pathway
MRIARISRDGVSHCAVVLADLTGSDPGAQTVVDITAAAPDVCPGDDPIPLLADAARRRAAADAAASAPAEHRFPLAEAALLAPIARPPKFLAIGLNYPDHIAESGAQTPQSPIVFNKQSTCVVGPHDAIERPRVSELLDYEGELGIVIGRRCRHVPAADALGVVAGYTIVNDVSVRDWQLRTPTMTMGKSFDTHGPIGPWIVSADEIPDPQALRIRTWVNGELRQDGSTESMVFGCAEQIEHLSSAFTLEPGDIVATGTPAGVGMARKPPAFLEPGDVVRIEIDGIGAIENTVVAEP